MEPRFAMRLEPTLRQRMTARLDELLWRKDFEFCEVLSGVVALGWGIVLLMPWSTFSTSPSFNAMAYAPEWLWGFLLLWIGLTQLGALLLDHRRPRRWSALGATFIWVFLSVGFFVSNPYGTGVVVYPALAASAGWAYLRIGRTPTS